MIRMLISVYLVFLLSVYQVLADYECVCNYNVEQSVLPMPDATAQPLGYLYEFDCKPTASQDGLDTSVWLVVAFEHKLGFVKRDDQIQQQICPGSPPVDDIVTTTTTTPKPTTPTTTTKPTTPTTTPKPTTTTTTPKPTTPTTTPKPTTTTTTTKPTTITTTPKPTTTTPKPTTPTTTTKPTTPTTTPKPTTTTTKPTTITTKPTTAIPKPTTTTSKSTTTATTTTPKPTTTTTTPKPTTRTTTTTPKPTTTTTTTTPKPTTTTTTPKPTTTTTTTTPKPTTSTTITTTKPTTTTSTTTPTTTTTTTTPRPTTQTTTPTTTVDPIVGNIYLCPDGVQANADINTTQLAQHQKSCYELIMSYNATWVKAESKCVERGGHLADITDIGEQRFIERFLQQFSPKHAVWIGFNDRQKEGQFVWSSGVRANYTNWYTGHSNHFVSHDMEDCTVFIPYKNGPWDDIPCQTYIHRPVHYPTLCEYRIPQ